MFVYSRHGCSAQVADWLPDSGLTQCLLEGRLSRKWIAALSYPDPARPSVESLLTDFRGVVRVLAGAPGIGSPAKQRLISSCSTTLRTTFRVRFLSFLTLQKPTRILIPGILRAMVMHEGVKPGHLMVLGLSWLGGYKEPRSGPQFEQRACQKNLRDCVSRYFDEVRSAVAGALYTSFGGGGKAVARRLLAGD